MGGVENEDFMHGILSFGAHVGGSKKLHHMEHSFVSSHSVTTHHVKEDRFEALLHTCESKTHAAKRRCNARVHKMNNQLHHYQHQLSTWLHKIHCYKSCATILNWYTGALYRHYRRHRKRFYRKHKKHVRKGDDRGRDSDVASVDGVSDVSATAAAE